MGRGAPGLGLTTAWCGVLAVAAAPVAGKSMAKVDPRRLVFGGLMWLAFVTLARTVATTDMTSWQIARPLVAMGMVDRTGETARVRYDTGWTLKLKILGISGSLRAASLNTMLLRGGPNRTDDDSNPAP